MKIALGIFGGLLLFYLAWFASAEPLAGLCAPGKRATYVPNGKLDPDQAKT